jgi:hypothetical protein
MKIEDYFLLSLIFESKKFIGTLLKVKLEGNIIKENPQKMNFPCENMFLSLTTLK